MSEWNGDLNASGLKEGGSDKGPGCEPDQWTEWTMAWDVTGWRMDKEGHQWNEGSI